MHDTSSKYDYLKYGSSSSGILLDPVTVKFSKSTGTIYDEGQFLADAQASYNNYWSNKKEKDYWANRTPSGAYGWNDGSAEAFWNNYMPIASSFHTFYTGAGDGNYGQMALGAGMLVLDIASLGEGSSLIKLLPLGLGTTGRTIATNLVEEMAMEAVMKNPRIGIIIMEGMSDSRWLGWSKMEYKVKTAEGVNAIVHYVGKWENGILKAVDDFKFK